MTILGKRANSKNHSILRVMARSYSQVIPSMFLSILEKYPRLLLPVSLIAGSFSFCRGDLPPFKNVTFEPIDPSNYTSPCGPQIYCLPAAGDQWISGHEYLLRWNYQYPTFLSVGFVDVKLYTEEDDYKPVQQWLNLTNSQGFLTYTRQNSTAITNLLQSGYPETQNITGKNFYFTVSTPNDKSSWVDKGPTFTIFDIRFPYIPPVALGNGPPPSAQTLAPSPSSEPNVPKMTESSPNPSLLNPPSATGGGLSGGAIAGISVGSAVAFLLLGLAVFIARRRSKNPRGRYVNEKMNTEYDGKGGSVYLRRGNTSASDVNSLSPLAGALDPPKRHSLRLTVKDAQLLAHHYRNMLTTKAWSGSSSEAQGTTYSDELLRRELAAEGRGVRMVNNAPAIVVVNDEGAISSEIMSVNPQVDEHTSVENGHSK
ncbi:hypothetical protein K493DRAFT_334940 [Basidiobolus meristosporus CBS 931.73]|uniref:Uncharacterized protein n=1 Tax=Basidiobolus meristosporus CBS 931.73 TaxID=1314790 RepID=A0A1Y1YVG7_9FUNG|nr:hypothetical protein K493DRAFT_334940 [Basidiobolus meristosporus CBS 931.73]|eukprot:ORY01565.1 hypothetical protein K493DRAFT_334940 [Basidiobolus meristosporus CBS 931.73]